MFPLRIPGGGATGTVNYITNTYDIYITEDPTKYIKYVRR